MRYTHTILIILILLPGTFYAGILFSQRYQQEGTKFDGGVRTASGRFSFINPLIECENNTLGARQRYIPFEKQTKSLIEETIQKKNPDIHLSVYFRNLNNGPWFGINENERFVPASLMKVPLLIMYLRWTELDPSILSRKITTEILTETTQYFKPEKDITLGTEHSIAELLEYMIRYSNNTASDTLIANIPESFLSQMLTDLAIPLPTDAGYALTVQEYASFFRILYNASYLNQEHSDQALNLLSQSAFSNGLIAKIPKNLAISHKFGERNVQNEDGSITNQLHDCGIIYYKPYPYLLCIMTRGENVEFPKLAGVLQDTSKIVYDQVSGAYKE